MPKRIVICSDGTWNTPDQRDGGEFRPTNVVKIARAVAPHAPDGTPQIVFYDPGVGTGRGLDRLTGGAFGQGLEKNIQDAYRFLMHNYDDGDDLFLFGFSRGAYTVRSTAGLLRNSGLLYKIHADRFPEAYALYRSETKPGDTAAINFRRDYAREVDITMIGVWDTVGALGIPISGLRWLSRGRQFHDTELSHIVKRGYQALAIDERRGPFEPALWKVEIKPGQVVEQVWFAGVHSNVGGGYQDTGLSDVAFLWMKEKAESCGLAFDERYVTEHITANYAGVLRDSLRRWYRLFPRFVRKLDAGPTQAVHPDALARLRRRDLAYQPTNLTDYLGEPDPKIADVRYRSSPDASPLGD